MSEEKKPELCACGARSPQLDPDQYGIGAYHNEHLKDRCKIGENWVKRAEFERTPRDLVGEILDLRRAIEAARTVTDSLKEKLAISVEETREARDCVRTQAALLAKALVGPVEVHSPDLPDLTYRAEIRGYPR